MAAFNKEELKRLGAHLNTKLERYKSDRKAREVEMMKDLRQYRAVYEPDIAQKLAESERSKVYPRDTRLKLVGFVAKMMEMMFPASEKNWSVTPEEYPNLTAADLNAVIEEVQKRRLEEAGEEAPKPLTAEDIAAAVSAFAKGKAENMEKEIEDQLGRMKVEYPQLCKHTVHSGGLYGWGVVVGPLTVAEPENVYEQNPDGSWGVKRKQVLRPELERHRSWDIYPDLSAPTWREQEGLFHRHVMSRHGLSALIDRPDFIAEEIKEYLKAHDSGNYKADSYEAELRVLDDTQNVQKLDGRRYEVYRYFGFISAKDMALIGVDVKEDDLYKDMLVDIWFIPGDREGTIIKAEQAVLGDDVGDQYHPYFYDDEEEAGLLGISLCSVVRDTQMKLAAVDRMTMDNAAACLGPITIIDKARLHRDNRNPTIGAFSTIYTDTSEDPGNSSRVVDSFQPDAHIGELLELREAFKAQMDMESNVQPVSLGDPTGIGEAFRTSGNFSQLTGGANMLTKDQVRAFDRFTSSVIGSLIKWNLKFNPKKEIKGDYQAVGRGNISLVAKEVRGAALAQWKTTLTPREQVLLKPLNLLKEELRSRDLSPDDILLSEADAQKALEAFDAAQAQAQSVEQGLTQAKTEKTQAEAQEILATMRNKIESIAAQVAKTIAQTKGEKTKNDLTAIKLLLDQIGTAEGAGGRPAGKAKGAKK